ncbi:hypothetical protein NQZ68_029268 [Dissostichus eleginoides]|nr:hypothetical protein NQZ68_029268 [Dissostichus eleginoides]
MSRTNYVSWAARLNAMQSQGPGRPQVKTDRVTLPLFDGGGFSSSWADSFPIRSPDM